MKSLKEKFKSMLVDLEKEKPVPQKGKKYYTVASRHKVFIKHSKDDRPTINTDIIPELCDDKRVAVKCTIDCDAGKYTGLAMEEFSFGYVNKTSALENAETSALGRALASFGLHGSEFCSADELTNAILNKDNKKDEDEEEEEEEDELYKATAKDAVKDKKEISLENRIAAIEAHFESKKPDLTTIKTLIVQLKSDQKHNYPDFVKSKYGKRLDKCETKLVKLKTNRR
tara:strand:- start:785 stop:1468 length:684 start_codon:yes stop_codon:yes gene_type:complete